MTLDNQDNEFVNLYATINITMPKNLTVKETNLFQQLSTINHSNHAEAI